MIKKLPYLLTCFLAALSYTAVNAQTYQQMVVSSGYNADVIANGVGPAATTTTMAVDNADFNFMTNNYQATASSTPLAYALPATGLITSGVAATPGLTFQLGPLSGNNSLRIPTDGVPGTLAFSNPVAATKLHLLVTSGSGNSTINVTINFSDATSQPLTAATVPDWFNSTVLPVAASGFGRVGRLSDLPENPAGNPRLYQLSVNISAANQSKTITSVQITKTSTAEGVVNLFAVTAEPLGTCPSPSALTGTSTATSGTVNWTPSVIIPTGGYDYYYSVSSTAPTAATTPSGNVGSAINTVTIPSLPTGVQYFFWVRSNCSASDKGPWQMTTFTTGQLTTTYTAGDISSSYFNTSEGDVTIGAGTTCPGAMTVNVPAGYQIASVSTSYSMTGINNAYQSEQRTLLACVTTNATEAAITIGPSVSAGGTVPYTRTGLTLANGAAGAVQFELRAWRTWTSILEDGCGVQYNKIDNNTWTVTVTYEPFTCTTPGAPTASNQTACPSATVANLVATGAPGASFKWYTASTGGTALATTTPLAATTYYAAQKVGNCESTARTAVVVTLAPTAVPTASSQAYCGGATVASLVATSAAGATIKWYATATGGGSLPAATVLVTTTYYVTQTITGCESARVPVEVTINTTAQPTATAQSHCPGATVTNLVATGIVGAVIKWYAGPTGGIELAGTTALAAGTYYVTQTVGTCESTRKAVVITIATLGLPTANAQTHCSGATVANLTATGAVGAVFTWYSEPTGGTALAGTALLVTGNYYVSQTLNTCESARKTVAVTVTASLDLPTAANQTVCSGNTVSNLTATGAAGAVMHWYAALTGGTELTGTTVLISGPYYVSQTSGTCESARKEITVTVTAALGLPTAADQTVCTGGTVSGLMATGVEGATFKWYAALTGGTALAGTASLASGPYYVSQIVGTCESARKEITVTVAPALGLPTAANQTVCAGSTVADLTATGVVGATMHWYAALTGGTALAGTASLASGPYYVSQMVGTCESARKEITVTVAAALAQPIVLNNYTYCEGATIGDITVGGIAVGAVVNWTTVDGDPVTAITELTTATYLVYQSMGDCESISAETHVVINEVPDAPGDDNEQDFNEGETLAALEVVSVEGATLHWYILDEDVYISVPEGTELVDGTTYYVSQQVGDCESDYFAITVNEILGTSAFELKNIVVHPNPAADVLTVSGNSMLSEIVITNLLGQEVMRQKVSGTSVEVNVSRLPQASYILQVYAAEGASATLKIVKQ